MLSSHRWHCAAHHSCKPPVLPGFLDVHSRLHEKHELCRGPALYLADATAQATTVVRKEKGLNPFHSSPAIGEGNEFCSISATPTLAQSSSANS